MSLVIIFLKVALASIVHDFYMSVSTISVEDDTARLEIKVFKDDLERVLGIALDDLDQKSKEIIYDYFDNNFKISSDELNVQLRFYRAVDLGESIVVFADFHLQKNKKFTVKNTIFLSEFVNQINIVHFRRPSKTDTVIFYRNKKTHTFVNG